MSSFLFLHFCDDALRLLGLYFSSFQDFPPVAFYRCHSNLHRSPTRLQQGRSGAALMRSPTQPPKRHTGPHGGEFRFCAPKRGYPSPKGGGAGYRFSWVCWVCSARSQTAHTAPTAPVWGCAGVVSPTRPPKPHTGAHRGEVGFTAFSWCASFAAAQQTVVPGGS